MKILPGAEAFRFDGGPVGVLLQHGFTGCPASMRPFGEWLAARGVTVLAPRLPGHGTTWEDLERTTWIDWERESERALAELAACCSTVVTVGLSMGAALALLRVTDRELPSLRAPLVVFASVEDHTVKPANARRVIERAGSERKELIRLT